jgi:hypothetical protein
MRGVRDTATWLLAAVALLAPPLAAQTIEFESGGRKYQAQTRGGITVMIAPLDVRILGYSFLQVAVSNGSAERQEIKPQNFSLRRSDGTVVRALSAEAVVNDVLDRAGRGDVGRLVSLYEAALFGNTKLELRHGYEARRKDAMAIGDTRMKAAATAAAIVLGSNRMEPGGTVDGAVLFPTSNRPLGSGQVTVEVAGEKFEFTVAPPTSPAK